MNLYLVLAIALGAITGVVEAPVLRPVQLVAASERRGERRVIRRRFSVLSSQFSVRRFVHLRTENCELRTLRGEAAPRAPAVA